MGISAVKKKIDTEIKYVYNQTKRRNDEKNKKSGKEENIQKDRKETCEEIQENFQEKISRGL